MKKIHISYIVIVMMLFGMFSESMALEVMKGIEIHGFVSQGYMKSDENNFLAETKDGTFEFNELGINFAADLTDKLRLGIQFFSHDLGPL